MVDSAFLLPKGIYQKYERFFATLKMDVTVRTTDKNLDLVEMKCIAGGDIKDFRDLVEATRLMICQQENLMADTGGAGIAWIFHK